MEWEKQCPSGLDHSGLGATAIYAHLTTLARRAELARLLGDGE